MNINKTMHWTAVILSVLFLIALALFSGLFGGDEPMVSLGSSRDRIAFTFWPVIYSLGLLASFRWVKPGALVSLAGLAGLFLVRTDLASDPIFLAMAAPGVLYLLSGKKSR